MASQLTEFDARTFRNALGCFATGITVVTTLDLEGKPMGLTANSFSSVSLDPPLVLFCLDRRASTFQIFESGTKFVINVLREDQEELSNRFAKSGPDKFSGVDYALWSSGVPILAGCIANLECEVETIADAGDHVIVVGRVLGMGYDEGDPRPLIYFRGRYAQINAG